MLFVCLEGTEYDGHIFAEEVVKKGSAVIVCSKPLSFSDDVTVIRVENCRKALAKISAAFYEHPSKELKLIGVTGTKGKTTVSYMIHRVLETAGIPCGLIGTVENITGRQREKSCLTTPESLDLHRMLRQMVDNGCKAAVIEVSSQALKLYRTFGLSFDIAILTNIGNDHISDVEHPDFQDYIRCKSRLFQQTRTAVINYDEPLKEQILAESSCSSVLTYGFSRNADCYVENLNFVKGPGKLGVEFQAKGRYNIELVIESPGRFAAYNGLAVFLTAKILEIPDVLIKKALGNTEIPGRQELFPLSSNQMIMVDFAHNGDALEALLKGIRSYNPYRITCVFGCGGQRDPDRRSKMAEAAAKYADFSIITTDNPRNESPQSIISDIIERMKVFNGHYCVIENRRTAIRQAVEWCLPGEIVVIAGKGHEDYQIFGSRRVHFDDREEVLLSIEKVKHEQNNNRRN